MQMQLITCSVTVGGLIDGCVQDKYCAKVAFKFG